MPQPPRARWAPGGRRSRTGRAIARRPAAVSPHGGGIIVTPPEAYSAAMPDIGGKRPTAGLARTAFDRGASGGAAAPAADVTP